MSEADVGSQGHSSADGAAGAPEPEATYELSEEPKRPAAIVAYASSAPAASAEATGEDDAGGGGRRGVFGRYVQRPLAPVKQVFVEFFNDDAFTLAAALAYYTALSFAPMIILLLTIASYLPGSTRARLEAQLYELLDEKAADVLTTIIRAAQEQKDVASTAGMISAATLLFSASGVFAQLQAALNRIWNVKAKPGGGVMAWVRKRLLSFGMVLALAFILIVSVVATAIIAGMFKAESGARAGWVGTILQVVNFAVTIGVFTALFGMIFKFLPDVKIAWRDVWFGALLTALLFAAGKLLIGLYLGNSAVGSSYGAAGSLIALLVWVYYSGLILFLGAEITEVWAERRGSSIEPDEYAVRVEREEHEV